MVQTSSTLEKKVSCETKGLLPKGIVTRNGNELWTTVLLSDNVELRNRHFKFTD